MHTRSYSSCYRPIQADSSCFPYRLDMADQSLVFPSLSAHFYQPIYQLRDRLHMYRSHTLNPTPIGYTFVEHVPSAQTYRHIPFSLIPHLWFHQSRPSEVFCPPSSCNRSNLDNPIGCTSLNCCADVIEPMQPHLVT
jgi:hypothetical protein